MAFSKTAFAGMAIAAVLVTAGASTAGAQEQGEWRSGGRLIYIDIDSISEPLFDTESTVGIDSSASLEYDMTYMVGENWGVEWMITAAPHDTQVVSGVFNGLDLGSLWIGQTTLTLQYMIPLRGRWRPYVGAGVGLGYVLYSDISSAAEAIGVDKLTSNLGWGPVGQVGLAHRLNRAWILSLDVKWISMPVDVELDGTSGTIDEVELDLDPLIIGLGAAYRF